MKNNAPSAAKTGILDEAKQAILSQLRKFKKKRAAKKLPLSGYEEFKPGIKYVDLLDDTDLAELNNLLDWNCFVADGHGRRFGLAAWGNKRNLPQQIPDPRIVAMHERFNLTGQHVLEVGCFEGIHTLALLQHAGSVTAIDARIDNVVKTIVRCAMFGFNPQVFKFDLENTAGDRSLLLADYLHHVGVLYHLKDPVSHLLELGNFIKKGVMLDTHYCLPEEADKSYTVGDKEYKYKHYLEYGTKEVFSGMYDHSKWLTLDDMVACLKQAGFAKVDIVETRAERNGPRVLLYAERV